MFDPNAVATIDQRSVANTGSLYPTIQWAYGDPKLKKAGGLEYQGGFFVPEEQVNADAMTDWERTTWVHVGGSEVAGFYRRDLVVSIIAARKRWEVYGDSGIRSFPWKAYDQAKDAGRPASRLHVLCLVKGLEDFGQFILTFKGSAAMAFEGVRGDGVLTRFNGTVLRAANMASDAAARKNGQPTGRKWPFRAFWLPVGADRTSDGDPRFTEVGRGRDTSHLVLPVALGLPAKPEQVDLGKFYVGNDLLAVGNDLWAEAEANWTHAWDTIEAEPKNGVPPKDDLPPFDDSGLSELGL